MHCVAAALRLIVDDDRVRDEIVVGFGGQRVDLGVGRPPDGDDRTRARGSGHQVADAQPSGQHPLAQRASQRSSPTASKGALRGEAALWEKQPSGRSSPMGEAALWEATRCVVERIGCRAVHTSLVVAAAPSADAPSSIEISRVGDARSERQRAVTHCGRNSPLTRFAPMTRSPTCTASMRTRPDAAASRRAASLCVDFSAGGHDSGEKSGTPVVVTSSVSRSL